MFVLSFTSWLGLPASAEPLPLHRLPKEARKARIQADLEAVQRYRQGLAAVSDYVLAEDAIFPARKLTEARLLTGDQKDDIRNTWKRILDYYLALDSIGQYHGSYWRVRPREQRHHSFVVAYSAFLAQYRFALDLIERFEHDPAFDVVLNEAVPELGLPKGAYTRFKFRLRLDGHSPIAER